MICASGRAIGLGSGDHAGQLGAALLLAAAAREGATTASRQDDRPLEGRILEQFALGPRTKNALALALKRNAQDVDDALTNLFT